MTSRAWVGTALLLFFLPACSRIDNQSHTAAIKQTVRETPGWVGSTTVAKRLWAIERDFYEARGYLPAWIDGDGTTPQLKDLLQQLRSSSAHGLDPEKYGVAEFEQLRDASQTRLRGTRFDVASVPELDARLTFAYLRYAGDLLAWGTNPKQVFSDWLTEPKKEDLGARLSAAIASGGVRQSLEELAPTHPQYRGLQAALAREHESPTGNAERIRMNLERWRWMPRDLGDRYILVNVPSYQLQVMEGDSPALAMRVIVGQPDKPTPLFSDQMTYVVFSPYWNIPENILREETLPRVARDPGFLDRNNIEVVGTSGSADIDAKSIDWSDESVTARLRFRQRPGPDNALGLVKFIFPNHFNIYLHDTPGDRLFAREHRTFSHGCIRIENPVAMAEYVLQDQPDWTEARITAAMNARQERAVTLKTPLPVHIGYWTAWVNPDGAVTYTDDPYGIDAAHERLRASAARSASVKAGAAAGKAAGTRAAARSASS